MAHCPSRKYDLVWSHIGRSRLALLSFSAPALKCSARDEWIGWSYRHQHDRLNLVANNSRFIIRKRDGCFAASPMSQT
ncbi:Druantia anti-phage system protein DruA [Nitrosomonas sp.]|uniref:Druantia anti-phage system protein DruA n=1 Tax=Nitrosomonas sp. TaxID=42353 RepID=UPI003523CE2F